MRRTVAVVIALLLSVCCLAAVAGGLAYLLWPRPVARPMVLINSPRYGEQVRVGQTVTVRSIARGEEKVVRVELWVDGQLQESQTSTLPGGTSPFPLFAEWQPSSPGTHTLVARAFNTQGARGQASISVEAIEEADRDGDAVPDEDDACPDEAGSETADGCPDRDRDGIADAEDACPDEAGLPEGEGCPVPSGGDLDGDGVLDEADVSPDEPGSPLADGSPDADEDGIPDVQDVRPDEPGLPEYFGGPAPGDPDGDGILDAADECPEEPGLPEHSGCPDGDGDGVRDIDDRCPYQPGLPELEGCPPPGPGEDELPPVGPDFLNIVEVFIPPPLPPAMTLLEFEALEFEVFDDYDRVYCYAALAGEGMERYGPFNPLGERRWDIAEYLGGENSRHVAVPMGEPLEVQVECFAYVTTWLPEGTAEAIYDLGSFERAHELDCTGDEMDEIVVQSDPGRDGHYFRVKYRICVGACEPAALPAPYIHTVYRPIGEAAHRIAWTWDGDDAAISGFNLYVNGNLWTSVGHFRSFTLYNLEPVCGERLELSMTAYSGDALAPDLESPRSNTIVLEGPACPRSVRVTFLEIQTHALPADPPGMDDDSCWSTQVGPIDVIWSVSDAWSYLYPTYGRGLCRFGKECNRIGGYCLHPNTTSSITDIIEVCRGNREHERDLWTECPNNEFTQVALGHDDDLLVTAEIEDNDTDGNRECLMMGGFVMGFDELVPGTVYERTISDLDGRGFADVKVRIEVLP
jgi:hypothetical protein